MQELICKRLNLFRHGGREEHGLAGEWQQFADAFDIRNEPHIKHPVRFVDHKGFNRRKKEFAPFEMVKQASWCCNQNVGASIEFFQLISERYAANEQRNCQTMVLSIHFETLLNLSG